VLKFFVAAAISAMAVPVFAASLEDRIAPCLACHAEGGNGANPEVPRLAAQPAKFLLIQLYLFREKMRRAELMTEAAQGLSDADLELYSEAISKLPPPQPAPQTIDPARMERAGALVHAHRCGFCHNHDFSGREHMPRLASQREAYLVKALREYKSGARHGYDPTMAMVLHPITDDQIVDLAYFLARVR